MAAAPTQTVCSKSLIFLTRERKNWMRLRSHTVVFDSEPDFALRRDDPSGALMRILHIWLADPLGEPPTVQAYPGSVRFCEGWYSRRELFRFFRRASAAAGSHGPRGAVFRHSLSAFLRE